MKVWPRTDCPTCGARAGEMCRNARGGRAAKHVARPLGSLGGRSRGPTTQMATIEQPTRSRNESTSTTETL